MTAEAQIAHAEGRINAQLLLVQQTLLELIKHVERHESNHANFEALVSARIDDIEKRDREAREAHWAAQRDGLLADAPW